MVKTYHIIKKRDKASVNSTSIFLNKYEREGRFWSI